MWQLLQFIRADEGIHFREFCRQLLAVTLDQTSGHDESPSWPFGLERRHLQDGVYGFLLGRFNEAAGVDDDDIGATGIVGEGIAALRGQAEHDFTINQIFGTAQADHTKAWFGSCHDVRCAFPLTGMDVKACSLRHWLSNSEVKYARLPSGERISPKQPSSRS